MTEVSRESKLLQHRHLSISRPLPRSLHQLEQGQNTSKSIFRHPAPSRYSSAVVGAYHGSDKSSFPKKTNHSYRWDMLGLLLGLFQELLRFRHCEM